MVHKCFHCAKSFPSGHYLKFHVNSVHAPKNKRMRCDLCPKSFSEHYYLRQHIKRMHSTIRPHVCNICSTSFSIKYDLVVHSRHVFGSEGYDQKVLFTMRLLKRVSFATTFKFFLRFQIELNKKVFLKSVSQICSLKGGLIPFFKKSSKFRAWKLPFSSSFCL